jgi:hypothetical protein
MAAPNVTGPSGSFHSAAQVTYSRQGQIVGAKTVTDKNI